MDKDMTFFVPFLLLFCLLAEAQPTRYSPIILNHHLYLGQNWVYPLPFTPKEVIYHPSDGVKLTWHKPTNSLRFTTKRLGTYGVQILHPNGTWMALNISIHPLKFQTLALTLQKLSLRGNVIHANFEKKKKTSGIILSGTIYEPQDWILLNKTLETFKGSVQSHLKLYAPTFKLWFQKLKTQVEKKYGKAIRLSHVQQHVHLQGIIDTEENKKFLLQSLKIYFPHLTHTALHSNLGSQEQVRIKIQFIELDKQQGLQIGIKHSLEKLSWSHPKKPFSFESFLSLMLSKGKAKVLSEPNLVVRHHTPAQLHIGGEIPYEIKTRQRLNVQWKSYGIRIQITPRPLKQDLYHLKFKISVRFPIGQGNSKGLPGFTTRSIQSEVIVPKNQTAILSGLLQHINEINQTGLPLFSDIPLLGHFFKHTQHRQNSTELIIAITPMEVDFNFENETQRQKIRLLNEEIRLVP